MKNYGDGEVNTLVLLPISSCSWISRSGSRYEKSCKSEICKDDNNKYKICRKNIKLKVKVFNKKSLTERWQSGTLAERRERVKTKHFLK